MGYWEAIILGIIQGLTEFLPVSSSGHLELANYFLGINDGNNLQFAMAVHAGTVLSTIMVFAREIGNLFRGLFEFRLNTQTLYIINLLISLLPVLFVGLFFEDKIEALFTNNLMLVGCMLLVTASLLAFSHFAKPRQRNITPSNAFVVGIAQAIAVLPGLSRSGSTISTGLVMGVKREEVSRFSFLMVLIPILGKNLLDAIGGNVAGTIPVELLVVGFLSAFITGTFACKWMINIVNRGKLIWFAIYCVIVGIGSIITYCLN